MVCLLQVWFPLLTDFFFFRSPAEGDDDAASKETKACVHSTLYTHIHTHACCRLRRQLLFAKDEIGFLTKTVEKVLAFSLIQTPTQTISF